MAELALTKDDIMSMPAGPELDALVAERVMGCRPKKGYFGYDCTCPKAKGSYKRPHSDEELHEDKCHSTSGLNCDDSALAGYSTEIAAAWEVAEVFIEAGCAAWVEGDGQTGYRAGCTSGAGRFEAEGDSPAHALCRAALLATAERLSE